MSQVVLKKTEEAIADSDIVLFMVDAREGVTEADRHYARWVRKRQGGHRGVYVVANKVEGQLNEQTAQALEECGRLGFGEPLALSASHGDGMGDFASALVPHYEEWEKEQQALAEAMSAEGRLPEGEEAEEPVQLALVGKPNVGIRKSGSRETETPLEELAVKDSINAIHKAQVVVLVLDGSEGMLRKTELSIASMVATEGRALVVAANKSDLSGVTPREYAQGVSTQVEELMPDMRAPPVVSVCALDGEFGCFLLLFVLNRFTGVQRYITKNLQKEFGFHGMQVRLTLKKSVNVYDPEGKGGNGKGRPKRKFGKRGRLLPQPPSPTRYRPGSHK
eukprot:jgi/Undpi1/6698/HiC_scaffold_20.g09177.m1